MKKNLVIIFMFGFFLNSCTARREIDYTKKTENLIKSTSWEKAVQLTILMVDFFFQIELASEDQLSPFIEFEYLKPYKLVVKNSGRMRHAFVSPDFYKSVAIWKIVQDKKEQLFPPNMDGYMVFPGKSIDFFFIPTQKGKFLLFCTVGKHRNMGMSRIIIVK